MDTYEKIDEKTLAVRGIKRTYELKELRKRRQALLNEADRLATIIGEAVKLGVKE